MKRPSIRISGPILVLIPVLLVAFVLSLVATWQGRRMAEGLSARVLDQAAARVETAVDGYLSNAVQATEQVRLLIVSDELDPARLPDWRPALYRQLKANREINSVTFGNEQGAATWMIRYPGEEQLEYAILEGDSGGNIAEYQVRPDGALADKMGEYRFDPRVRPWYRAAVAANQPTWSEPYAWVGGDHRPSTLGIAYCVPIDDQDGRLIGVLEADISLQDVSRFLKHARAFERGESVLIDADGKLIGTSLGLEVVDSKGNRIAANEVDNPVVSGIARRIGAFSAIDKPRELEVEDDENAYTVEVRPFQNPWGLDWRLAVIVPQSEIMAGVDSMRRQAWTITGIVILLTLGLGLLAAKSIVGPVTELAAAVRKMGTGNLDDAVRVGGHQEFVQLSDELNRMSVALKDRMRLRQSLSLAMEIQQKLLPSAAPSLPGLDVAGHSTYCDETGGDYFDFIELSKTDSEELIVVLGDVMGHGVAAALLMATARGILRSRSGDEDSLGGWLTHVNQLLVEDTGGERFMTMALLVCDPKRRRIRLASAGHDLPLVYLPNEDRFLELPDTGGLPLGIVSEEEYHESKFEVSNPGTILLVGTDGLWESENIAGEPFGKERICEIIRAHATASAQQISDAITQGLAEYRGDARQDDDITFVVVKFTATELANVGSAVRSRNASAPLSSSGKVPVNSRCKE